MKQSETQSAVGSTRLLGVNEQTFRDFIEEQKAQALTVEWVNWMLQMLSEANRKKVKINPAWLRANGRMLTARGVDDEEPPMVYA